MCSVYQQQRTPGFLFVLRNHGTPDGPLCFVYLTVGCFIFHSVCHAACILIGRLDDGHASKLGTVPYLICVYNQR